jgi:exopolyphosphatase/guanosine-5'-triphosphate,3'-diphosphate pyrophosphatase
MAEAIRDRGRRPVDAGRSRPSRPIPRRPGPAVESLGLRDFLNTSYPDGLSALLDDAPPRFAVIDVGSNSIKFHVGEVEPDGSFRTVADRAEVTRLGEDVRHVARITEAALDRSLAAIAGMVDEPEPTA